MTNDEKFDTWLAAAARDYHRPPAEVPREAMWQTIAARVATPVPGSTAAGDAEPGASLPSSRRAWARSRWIPLAAAAAALVVVSYQAGRRSMPPAPDGASIVQPTLPALAGPMYDAAAMQHFGRAEALLTSLRAEAAPLGQPVQRWAHDLLADTRLLLDSPAATDPARRRLLQDLELTLAQIVQLPAAATPDDQRLVEGSLRRGELLTRIRSAVPSTLGGT